MNKKILILGHARHGKDTVAELICKHTNLLYQATSFLAYQIFIYDELINKHNHKYDSIYAAFNDRFQHRNLLYNMIKEYNKNDKASLAKDVLQHCDIYVGMRDVDEVIESKLQNIFDLTIGVYNPNIKHEDISSNTVDVFKYSDILIINDSTLIDLENKIIKLTKYKF